MKTADSSKPTKDLTQVGALPLKVGKDGQVSILLVTSRETKRWVIPKGWPMKGRKPYEAAAQEALEEAGVVGKPDKRPIGFYHYYKRRPTHFDLCRVDVYVLHVEKELKEWREKGQRELRWFALQDAADLVQEPGLIDLIRHLDPATAA